MTLAKAFENLTEKEQQEMFNLYVGQTLFGLTLMDEFDLALQEVDKVERTFEQTMGLYENNFKELCEQAREIIKEYQKESDD